MAGLKPNGMPQTCQQAFQGAQQQSLEDIASADTAKALHTIEDSYAGGHKGFRFWPGGMPSASHEHDDWFPSDEAVNGATQAAAQFLRDLSANRDPLNAGNPVDVDPARYFPPNPCN